MRAFWAYIIGERQVEFREVEIPDEPGPRELLVRTLYTAVSPGTELSIYTGLDPDTRSPNAWCRYPYACGYTGVGEVLKVGSRLPDFKVGDLVYGFLGHRSHQVCSADRFAYRIAEDIHLPLVPFVRFGTIAFTGIARSHLQLGDTCVVFGLGCVGLMAAQLARAAGATVVGVDPVDFRRRQAMALGIDFVCTPEPEAISNALYDANGTDKCDVVIDAVGSSEVIATAARYVAECGEIVLVGTPRAPYQADMTPLMRDIHLRGVVPVGALEWLIPVLPCRGVKHNYYRSTDIIFRLHRQGRVNLEALVSEVMPAHNVQRAYEVLLEDKEHYIGVALDWTSGELSVTC
jgi:2-desacetyl-2-hydroxyethyl bacteriochlorophyllide A dehydrogenase